MTPRPPNFFIVGAPKCGTSAMSWYVAEHPDVFITRPKEPAYFAFDIEDPVVRPPGASWSWYMGLFEDAGDVKYLGEASVFYLFSEVAIPKIEETVPDARYVAMFRNPVDLVHSFHSQLVFSGQETEEDFEAAWRRGPIEGESVLLDYSRVGSLGEQYGRMLETVDPSRVHAIVYDDLRADTRAEYLRVLDFLGLEDDGRTNFRVVNPNRSHRSKTLTKVLDLVPDPAPIKKLLGIERVGLMKWIREKNMKIHSREPLRADFRRELQAHFADDVALLGKLLGRDDVNAWCRPE
jgi:hypothetical protein